MIATKWLLKLYYFLQSLHISKCDNLIISGITSIDSPKNHISIAACTNVVVSNIGLFAPEDSPNTDGIDISRSTNVNIFDSTIQTGTYLTHIWLSLLTTCIDMNVKMGKS